jgi:hypothetical protein
MQTGEKILNLEVVENGTLNSLIADDGTIYATGRGSQSMLREAGIRAAQRGYESILIGTQRWDCATLAAM